MCDFFNLGWHDGYYRKSISVDTEKLSESDYWDYVIGYQAGQKEYDIECNIDEL